MFRRLYQVEIKDDKLIWAVDFGLRNRRVQGTIIPVRRTFGFLQYGTSARLEAPLIQMPAPEHVGRKKAWRKEVFAAFASPQWRGFRTGWSRNPSSSGMSNRRGPQGKAAVEPIVAGLTFTRGVYVNCEARQQK